MRRVYTPTMLVVGLALVLAACGQAARTAPPRVARPTSTATSLPIATPALAPATALAWQTRTPPAPIPANPYAPNAGPTPDFALTQANSNTAYACAPDAKANTVHVWLTHDGGAHWSPVADIATTSPASYCTLVADDLDPAIVVATIYYPHPGYCCLPGPDLIVATRDSGQSWAPLHGPDDIVSEMETRQGVTYALFHPHPEGADQLYTDFVMSRDGLHTWQPVNRPLGSYVIQFWVNPYDGRMLALTNTGWMDSSAFWTSPGPGQTWHSASTPPYGFEGSAVQQPYTAAPWVFCGADPSSWYIDGKSNTHQHDIECSADSGATWRVLHLDETDYGPAQPEYTLLAVAADGAVLLQSPTMVARVVLPSARIEVLGSYPNAGALAYVASGGRGVLWSGPFFNYSDTQGKIYTATYV